MTTITTRSKARSQAINAVVHRADGRVEDLGLISFYHRNPLIHYPVNFYIRIKEFLNGRSRSR